MTSPLSLRVSRAIAGIQEVFAFRMLWIPARLRAWGDVLFPEWRISFEKARLGRRDAGYIQTQTLFCCNIAVIHKNKAIYF